MKNKFKDVYGMPDPACVLKLELDAIDNRRNLNWKLVFPWLEEYINN